MWISLLPFCGIMYSPLEEMQLRPGFAVNFVMMSEAPDLKRLEGYLQIFNRKNLSAYDITGSDKNLKKILHSAKDEIVIFCGMQDTSESYYRNKKIANNCIKVAQRVLGQRGVSYGEEKDVKALVVYMRIF